jgi:hypothetical protein
VYDGSSRSYPLIGRFCGTGENAVPDMISTTSNQLLLVFLSAADSPPYGFRGFHASVQGITKGAPIVSSLLFNW